MTSARLNGFISRSVVGLGFGYDLGDSRHHLLTHNNVQGDARRV